MKKALLLLSLLLACFFFYSCEKETIPEPKETTSVPETLTEDDALKGAQALDLTREEMNSMVWFARMGAGAPEIIPTDGKYGIIHFNIQNLDLIPEDFNLATFYHWPAEGIPAEEWATEGYLWLLPDAMVPYVYIQYGKGAVPFWIIKHNQIAKLTADGVVTLDEIAGLKPAPLIGYARQYVEIVKPYGGGAPVNTGRFLARGELEDGRSFVFFRSVETVPGEYYEEDVFLRIKKKKYSFWD